MASEPLVHEKRIPSPQVQPVQSHDPSDPPFQPLSKKRTDAPRSHNPLWDWWFEVVCILFMTASLIAIAVSLFKWQDKEVPHWPIGFNSMLSIFAVVFKSSMLLVVAEAMTQNKWLWFRRPNSLRFVELFDAAARGPLGCFKLLWASRSNLAQVAIPAMGALAIILALVVDPFVQQLFRSESCLMGDLSLNASVSALHGYTLYDPSTADQQVPRTMLGSFWSSFLGTFQENATPPPFQCQGTGSCNITTPYWNIGFCSECTDYTSTLQHLNPPGLFLPGSNSSKAHNLTSGNYFSIDRDIMSSNWSTAARNSLNTFIGYSVMMNLRKDDSCIENYNGTNRTECVPQSTLKDYQGNWSPTSQDVGAARCALYPCTQRFAAINSFTAASIAEKVQEAVPLGVHNADFNYNFSGDLVSASNFAIDAIPSSCLSEPEDDEKVLRGNNFTFTDSTKTWHPPQLYSSGPWLDHCTRGTFSPGKLAQICARCYFSFDTKQFGAWQEAFGQISPFSRVKDEADDFTTMLSFTMQAGVESQSLQGNQLISYDRLYREGNISFLQLDTAFKNVARALSIQMRRDAGVKSYPYLKDAPVKGIVTTNKVCLRVHWPWISLPLVLYCLVVIYMGLTLAHSSQSAVGSWKSSNLPLLFHGPGGDALRPYHGDPGSIHYMKSAAEDIRVSLRADSNGYMLVPEQAGGDFQREVSPQSDADGGNALRSR